MINQSISGIPFNQLIQKEAEKTITVDEKVHPTQEVALHENILKKKFEPFTDTLENDNGKLLIESWLSEEGFKVDESDEHKYREKYRFIAEKKNERYERQYLIEVKDHGRQISKLKLLILKTGTEE